MTKRLNYHDPQFAVAFRKLINDKRETQADVGKSVKKILSDVRARGDIAVCEATAKFDRFQSDDAHAHRGHVARVGGDVKR